MIIDDAIQTLTKINQSTNKGIPKKVTRPDALVNYLNDLYSDCCEGFTLEELFAYDDVTSPSITLTIGVNVEFEIKKVMENMRTRLHIKHHSKADEIGKTGIVWSHGRYDFVCDDDAGLLRISHRYSHKRLDISVSTLLANSIFDPESTVELLPQSEDQSFRQPFQYQLYVHRALLARDAV